MEEDKSTIAKTNTDLIKYLPPVLISQINKIPGLSNDIKNITNVYSKYVSPSTSKMIASGKLNKISEGALKAIKGMSEETIQYIMNLDKDFATSNSKTVKDLIKVYGVKVIDEIKNLSPKTLKFLRKVKDTPNSVKVLVNEIDQKLPTNTKEFLRDIKTNELIKIHTLLNKTNLTPSEQKIISTIPSNVLQDIKNMPVGILLNLHTHYKNKDTPKVNVPFARIHTNYMVKPPSPLAKLPYIISKIATPKVLINEASNDTKQLLRSIQRYELIKIHTLLNKTNLTPSEQKIISTIPPNVIQEIKNVPIASLLNLQTHYKNKDTPKVNVPFARVHTNYMVPPAPPLAKLPYIVSKKITPKISPDVKQFLGSINNDILIKTHALLNKTNLTPSEQRIISIIPPKFIQQIKNTPIDVLLNLQTHYKNKDTPKVLVNEISNDTKQFLGSIDKDVLIRMHALLNKTSLTPSEQKIIYTIPPKFIQEIKNTPIDVLLNLHTFYKNLNKVNTSNVNIPSVYNKLPSPSTDIKLAAAAMKTNMCKIKLDAANAKLKLIEDARNATLLAAEKARKLKEELDAAAKKAAKDLENAKTFDEIKLANEAKAKADALAKKAKEEAEKANAFSREQLMAVEKIKQEAERKRLELEKAKEDEIKRQAEIIKKCRPNDKILGVTENNMRKYSREECDMLRGNFNENGHCILNKDNYSLLCKNEPIQPSTSKPSTVSLFSSRVLWLDSSDEKTLSFKDNKLVEWRDKSNYNNHFSTLNGFQPTQDKDNSISFNKSLMFSKKAAVYPLDLFIVIKLNNLDKHNDVIGISPANRDNFNSLTFGEYSKRRWHNGSSYFTRTGLAVSQENEEETDYMVIQYTLANNNYVIHKNGKQIMKTNSYTWNIPNDAIYNLGCRIGYLQQKHHTDGLLKGNIKELIVFERVLSEDESKTITKELIKKHLKPVIPPKPFDGNDFNTIPGLKLWLDASTITGSNGQKIKVVNSSTKYDNSFECMSKNESDWPTLVTNELNGKSILNFKTNNNMSMTKNIISQQYTFIFVTRQVGNTNRRLLIGNGNRLFGYWGGGKNQLFVEGWLTEPAKPPSDDEWDIYTISRDLENKVYMTRNGKIIINGASTSYGFNGLYINTGGCCGGETSDGQVAEILLSDKYIEKDDISKIVKKLANKWGIKEEIIVPVGTFDGKNFNSMNGLRLWIDASTIDGKNGDKIQKIISKSNKKNSLENMNNDINQYPTLKKNGLNDKNVLSFRFFNNMSMIKNVKSKEYTLIFITRQVGGINRRFLIGNGNKLYGYWNGAKHQLHIENWLSQPGVPSSNKKWDLYTVTKGLDNKVYMTRNGKTIVNGVNSEQNFDGLFFNVGGCCSGETSDAELAEVALWKRALGPDNIKSVVTYLAEKWGLNKRVPNKYNVEEAFYGEFIGGRGVYVTDTVLDYIINDKSGINVNTNVFGDPAIGVYKKLFVVYTPIGGKKKTISIGDGQYLDFDLLTTVIPFDGTDFKTIPGLKLWIDANTINGSNGQKIKVVKSANNNSNSLESMTNDSNQWPTLITNALNGKSVLDFKINNNMSMTTNIISNQYTLIFVSRQLGTVNRRLLIGNGNRLFGYWGGGKNQLFTEGWLTESGRPLSDDEWDIYTVSRDLQNRVYMTRNGKTIVNGPGSAVGFDGLFINVGGCCGGETSNGQVAEILLSNKYVEKNDITKIVKILSNKWGIKEEILGPIGTFDGTNFNSVDGLRLWVDASTLNGQNGDKIQKLVSLSDKKNAIENITGDSNKYPTLKKNGLNNKNILSFKNYNNMIMSNKVRATEYTLIFLTRQVGGQNGRFLIGNGNKLFGYWNGGKDQLHIENWISQAGKPNSDNKWDLYAISKGSDNKVFMSRNGKTIINGIVDYNNFDGLFFNTGGCCGNETSDAELAEVILWKRAIGENNIKLIVSYLAQKWGIN